MRVPSRLERCSATPSHCTAGRSSCTSRGCTAPAMSPAVSSLHREELTWYSATTFSSLRGCQPSSARIFPKRQMPYSDMSLKPVYVPATLIKSRTCTRLQLYFLRSLKATLSEMGTPCPCGWCLICHESALFTLRWAKRRRNWSGKSGRSVSGAAADPRVWPFGKKSCTKTVWMSACHMISRTFSICSQS